MTCRVSLGGGASPRTHFSQEFCCFGSQDPDRTVSGHQEKEGVPGSAWSYLLRAENRSVFFSFYSGLVPSSKAFLFSWNLLLAEDAAGAAALAQEELTGDLETPRSTTAPPTGQRRWLSWHVLAGAPGARAVPSIPRVLLARCGLDSVSPPPSLLKLSFAKADFLCYPRGRISTVELPVLWITFWVP